MLLFDVSTTAGIEAARTTLHPTDVESWNPSEKKATGSINKAGTNCLPIAVTCHSLSGKPEFKRESQGRAEDFNRRKIPIFRYFRDENTEKHWLNCSFWSKIAVLPTFLDHTGLKY